MKKITSKEQLSRDDIYDQIGTWEDAQRIGETVARAALRAFQNIECNSSSRFHVMDKMVKIPVKDYEYGSDIASAFRRLTYNVKRIAITKLAKMNIFKRSILLATENLSGGYLEAYLQVITLGNIIIYTIPAEFFLKLANEIISYSKQYIPQKDCFVVELANDSIGYMYTIQAYIEGGYESSFSLTPLGGRYLTMKIKEMIKNIKEE